MDLAGRERPSRTDVLVAALSAVLLAAGSHLILGDRGLNLRDEGYLWYGVLRVLEGEVPLRDFQAYDPGRYYWCAALSPLLGSGLLGVRASVAVFEGLGLFAGLLVARRVLPGARWLPAVGLLLVLWMFPRHKLFEPSLTLLALLFVTRLLERPTAGRHLALGSVVGLAGVFGRNHGLYLGLASLALFALLARGRDETGVASRARGVLAWGAGVLLGYAPLLSMLALVPGFAASFRAALLSVLERGANIPKAYRWPWSEPHAGLALPDLAGALALDAAFLLPVLVLPLGLALALRSPPAARRARAVPIAAALVGTVYVHHYAVCSDLPHLAQAVPPLLLLALALAALRWRGTAARAAVLGGLCLHAGLIALEGHPQLRDWKPGAVRHTRLAVDVGGDELSLERPQGAGLRRLREVVRRFVPPEEGLFVAPTMPMYYPILGKRSPVWWIYFLWPATEEEQETTIRTLRDEDVDWALIIDKPFNGMAEYNFDATNPLVWGHLQDEWTEMSHPLLQPAYHLFRRR
jgi:hypothetical protein